VAFCWGWNTTGQLGDGTQTQRLVPTRVATDTRFTAVNPGNGFTCAAAEDNRAWCWGTNFAGQLGDGTFSSRSVPAPVAGGRQFTVFNSPGDNNHSCGVTSSGSLYCWGLNLFAQIGDGTFTNRPVPVKVSGSI
jgi:alpha-tubulin suppressor-like RCC1 family protein